MFVLFLDFDGVFLTARTRFNEPDLVATQYIGKELQENKGKIVVSSTWRLREDPCKEMLNKCNLSHHVHEDWRTKRLVSGFRGDEIDEWLSRHPEVKDYIILDDDSDFHAHHSDHFVQTHYADGMLTTHMMEFSDMVMNIRGAHLQFEGE